jgi:hypothetical protein
LRWLIGGDGESFGTPHLTVLVQNSAAISELAFMRRVGIR